LVECNPTKSKPKEPKKETKVKRPGDFDALKMSQARAYKRETTISNKLEETAGPSNPSVVRSLKGGRLSKKKVPPGSACGGANPGGPGKQRGISLKAGQGEGLCIVVR